MDRDERVPRIAEINIRVKPDHYLGLAHAELQKGNPIAAIQFFMLNILNLSNPQEMKLIDQISLTKLIINLNRNIDDSAQVQNEVMKCYLSVLNSFPENALLLNDFGLYFFAQGEYTVSRSYFQRAAALNYLPGEKNFLHVIWNLIPRWHFRMLNDRKRNECYQKAITRAIKRGFNKVCDIGTGCGLLSLIATRSAKDVSVIAFEESKILSGIASRVFKRNNSKVKLITKNSNKVTKPPEKCSLIVTEIFDAGLFGEHCLKSIKHALEHFVTEQFKVIPAFATLYVTAFSSKEISKSHRFVESYPILNLCDVCVVEDTAENYDAEYLKRKSVTFVTHSVPILSVNFADRNQLEHLIVGFSTELELKSLCDARIDGLAVWFDLHLDEEMRISTHPSNPDNSCWEQAVFHLHPVNAKANETVKFKFEMVDAQLKFSLPNQCGDCFKVSQEIVTFLNDRDLVESIMKAAAATKNVRVVDFNCFPLFGFLMAKKGSTVYHVYKAECDLIFFNHLLDINKIPKNKFMFIDQKKLEDNTVYVEAPDIVFTNFIQTDGSWNTVDYALEEENRFKCETMMPRKIFLNAVLIASDFLDFSNKVDDNNALNFEIFAEINEFTGSEHPNLDNFDHETLSTVARFDISNVEIMDFHADVTILRDGISNGILYWFDMQFSHDEANTFSTLNSTHFKRSCTLLNTSKSVKTGDTLPFHIMRLEGHLKVYCDL